MPPPKVLQLQHPEGDVSTIEVVGLDGTPEAPYAVCTARDVDRQVGCSIPRRAVLNEFHGTRADLDPVLTC